MQALSLTDKNPFSASILMATQSQKIKFPSVDAYDGTTDPDDHLAMYKHLMLTTQADDATWCKYFPVTLKGLAQRWFSQLPTSSIHNFNELVVLFTHHFMAHRQEKKSSLHLERIQQCPNESLRSYVKRFNNETLQISDLPDRVIFDNFFRGLDEDSPFKFQMARQRVASLNELMNEAERWIHAEEVCAVKRPKDKGVSSSSKLQSNLGHQSGGNDRKRSSTWNIEIEDSSKKGKGQKKKKCSYTPTVEYTKDLFQVYKEVSKDVPIEDPPPINTELELRDKSKYCEYHEDVGHVTDDCFTLQ
ncbi:uncharacterized protein LOC104890717 [Beta vulgaris subsp. vulgaris]|uniref:uncharacterized protein LOC104890717 n=1 Tax=Beta vulgaris subsp. vulgaris TaxID=3555 RepID=UPI000540043C|nr:uncharacterized protein LOC104890717 [Beta vulgaris subsp. vulgaris]